MKGTIANTAAVLLGGLIGSGLGNSFLLKYQQPIMQALKITVGIIGVQMALKTENLLIVILSLVIGIIIGEQLNLEKYMQSLASKLMQLTNYLFPKMRQSRFQEGFITASLVYCVGAMAIVGSIQDGLQGQTEVLYLKSVLDGVSAIVFATTFGIGVAFSAIPVFVYQASITLLAEFFSAYFTPAVIREITAVGGVSFLALAIKMLEIEDIKVANWLPAIIVAAVLATVL